MPNLNLEHCKRNRSAFQMLVGITLHLHCQVQYYPQINWKPINKKKNQKPGFVFRWTKIYFSVMFLFINGSNDQLPSPQVIVKKHCPRSSSVLGKVCHLSYASLCHKQCSSSDSCSECLQVTTQLYLSFTTKIKPSVLSSLFRKLYFLWGKEPQLVKYNIFSFRLAHEREWEDEANNS